jgi:hypothetical protein
MTIRFEARHGSELPYFRRPVFVIQINDGLGVTGCSHQANDGLYTWPATVMQPELGSLAGPSESGPSAQCSDMKNLEPKNMIQGANSRMLAGPIDRSTMFPCREHDT